jgi:ubiquinol-cytochrome c reductase iron-sulfur subunit
MINIASKAGNYLRASTQVVSNGLKPLAAGVPKQQNVVVEKQEKFTLSTQVRLAHTDIRVPDFSDYRRDSTKRPASASKSADDRRAFTYYW